MWNLGLLVSGSMVSVENSTAKQKEKKKKVNKNTSSKREKEKEQTLIRLETSAVHGLADDAEGELERLVDVVLGVVLLFEHTLSSLVVGTDRGGLPAAIVATGIRVVELELKVSVPSSVQVRHSKRPQTFFFFFFGFCMRKGKGREGDGPPYWV